MRCKIGPSALSLLLLFLPCSAWAERSAALEALGAPNAIVILRHAQTDPGTGDPAGFRLDDCSTQRNLSERGRSQAEDLGERLRSAGLVSAVVLASPWCRTKETAALLDLGPVETWDLLASLWNDRLENADRTEELRAYLQTWQGPQPLVLVTHGINLRRLLGRSAAQGGGYVLLADPNAPEGLIVVGPLP